MTSPVVAGLLTGAGDGIAKVGMMMAQDQLETKRQKMLAGLKEESAEKDRAFKASETDKSISATASENQKDRESQMDIAKIQAQAKKDAAAAKDGKPTSSWQKYQELKAKYLADNDGKITKEADNYLMSVAYGADERFSTKDNEVIFTGLLSGGVPGVTAEYARPVDESGTPTGSRRDREFRTVPEPDRSGQSQSYVLDPKKYAAIKYDKSQKYQDGVYEEQGIEVINGVPYKLLK